MATCVTNQLNMKVAFRIITLLFSSLLLAACLGSVRESKDHLVVCQPSASVAGLWRVTEVIKPDDCPNTLRTEQNTYSITQKDCILTIKDGNRGEIYSGIIKNNAVSLTGSFNEAMGIVTFDNTYLTLNAEGNTMNGYITWTWRGAGDSCTGKTYWTFTRLNK